MKKNLIWVVAVLVGVVAQAAVERIVDGIQFNRGFAPQVTLCAGTHEVNATLDKTTALSCGNFKNSYRYPVCALDGAVLKTVTSGSRADLACALFVTNGTVTLDLTGLDASIPFRYQGSIWVEGDGRLVVKGRDSLVFGQEVSDTTSARTAATLRAAEISFVDGDGVKYANPTMTMAGYVAEIQWPTNVAWSIASGANVIEVATGAGGHGVYDKYVSDGAMTLSDFDLQLNSSAAFGSVTVTVNEDRTFRVYPRTFVCEGVDAFNYNGNSGTVFANNVILNGGTYYLGNHYTSSHTGNISGNGHLVFSPTGRQSGASVTTISGTATFTGDVTVSCSASSPLSTLVFKQASPGAAGNAVTITSGSTLRLEPTVTPAAGSIGSLDAGAGATNYIASGVTLTVSSEPTGDVVFTGAGVTKSTLVAGFIPSAGHSVICHDCGVSLSDEAKAVTTEIRHNGDISYYRPLSDGVVDLSRFAGVSSLSGRVVVAAKDGFNFVNVPSNVTVTAASGVAATVTALPLHEVTVEAAEGAEITVNEASGDWESYVISHFDFSDRTKFQQFPTAFDSTHGTTRVLDGVEYPVVSNFYDNAGVYYVENEQSWRYTSISPLLITNGVNGLSYISCYSPSACPRVRLQSAATGNAVALNPAYAVVVFGSQRGGGGAIFGDNGPASYLRGGLRIGGTNSTGTAYADSIARIGDGLMISGGGRAITKSYGIFSNDTMTTHLDGVKVVQPSTQPLSGGWQIISFRTGGKAVNYLGAVNSPSSGSGASNCGGQNYAEVIFFNKELSDVERISVERMLAKKWGITAYADSDIGKRVSVSACGAGTVKLGKDATLSAGSFRGTLYLNGKSLEMADASLPPDQTAMRAVAEPTIWFDPDVADSISFASGGLCIDKMYDWRKLPFSSYPTDSYYVDAVSRYPRRIAGARGEGDSHYWIDYSPQPFGGTKANGRGLRFKKKGSEGTVIYNVQPATVRTVIMAQDSSKTGGTPFMDTVAGKDLPPRNPPYASNGPTLASSPIWLGKSATLFSTGATYLDGQKVDGAVTGFQGRPEILTAVGGKDFSLGTFAHVAYLDTRAPNDVDEGEIHGEILVYDSVLSDAARQTAEAYLAWKWCGLAISGYACYTNLTVSGSGSVKVNGLEQMPKFASDYTGSIDLSSVSELSMTVTRGSSTVAGARKFAGTANFPAAVTVNVSYADGTPKTGTYDLITASGGLSSTTWTLNAPAGREVSLDVSEKAVRLVVVPRGVMLIIR